MTKSVEQWPVVSIDANCPVVRTDHETGVTSPCTVEEFRRFAGHVGMTWDDLLSAVTTAPVRGSFATLTIAKATN